MSLEGAGGGFSRGSPGLYLRINFPDTLVDFHCRRPAHLIGDMGVDVQRGAAGYVPDDSGEGLDIHAMFQGNGRKCVPEVMKSDLFAPGSFQNGLQPLSDSGGISGRVLVNRRGEHPFRVYDFPIFFENAQYGGGKDQASVSRFGFGWRDHEFSFDSVNLPLHSEFPGAEVQIVPLQGTDLTPAEPGG